MLKKRFLLCVLVLFCSSKIFSQSSDFEVIMANGSASYELGNYEVALDFFNQAYKYDKTSNLACYELAVTYLALQQYQNAAIYSGKVISQKGEYLEDAYLVNGSAWESLGREFRAQKTYKEGLKHFRTSYLLHYNLALLFYNNKEYDDAEASVIKAIESLPAHASSHLLLAYIMFDKGERVKSMLPLYYFLLIDQDSERSSVAYDLLSGLWEQGVRTNGQRDIKLVKAGYNYSEFGSAELAISLMKSQEETEMEVKTYVPGKGLIEFAQNNKRLFKILSESDIDKNGFWWEYYVSFFSKIERNNLSEPFSYFISSCKYNEDVLLWLSNHEQDFQRFTTWIEVY